MFALVLERQTVLIALAVGLATVGLLLLGGGATPASLLKAGSGDAGSRTSLSHEERGRVLRTATWNVGAINNNPFEYWLSMTNAEDGAATADAAAYDALLASVETFVKSPPANKDVQVSSVFTEQMYHQLRKEMEVTAKWSVEDLKALDGLWRADWSKRKIVSEFVRDPTIGLKRLVSMPDRMTNTIVRPSDGRTFYRPTSVNCYDARLVSVSDWYKKWLDFMFRADVTGKQQSPASLLKRIPRAKYPALSEEEEVLSIPLQTLVIALFDAIQIRMLNQLVGSAKWQNLRGKICSALNVKKVSRTLEILDKTYKDVDVFFLQETAASFVDKAQTALGSDFHVVTTEPGTNDQNSMILLKKSMFPRAPTRENDVTSRVVLPPKMVSKGDLILMHVQDARGTSYLLGSFHGDTNGLASIPLLQAVHDLWSTSEDLKDSVFLFGLDANTYAYPDKAVPSGKVQLASDFMTYYQGKGLWSCWGSPYASEAGSSTAQESPLFTTRNARTFMQPQLSKGASKSEIETKGDFNPKDFILFSKERFRVASSANRDNTGFGRFVPDIVFPTLGFPSDHAILSVDLVATF